MSLFDTFLRGMHTGKRDCCFDCLVKADIAAAAAAESEGDE